MRSKFLSSLTLPLALFLSVYLRLTLPDRTAAAIRVRREGGRGTDGGRRRGRDGGRKRGRRVRER